MSEILDETAFRKLLIDKAKALGSHQALATELGFSISFITKVLAERGSRTPTDALAKSMGYESVTCFRKLSPAAA